MALIVEDGTGITGANALISVAEFDAFAADRGIPNYTYLASDKESAIVVATVDFINTDFKFIGEPLKTIQGLQIPTQHVGVEQNIKLACYHAALLHLKNRLFVDPLDFEVSGQIVAERSKLDVLEEEKTYKPGSNYTNKYPTPQIDKLLQPYTTNYGGLGSMKRW